MTGAGTGQQTRAASASPDAQARPARAQSPAAVFASGVPQPLTGTERKWGTETGSTAPQPTHQRRTARANPELFPGSRSELGRPAAELDSASASSSGEPGSDEEAEGYGEAWSSDQAAGAAVPEPPAGSAPGNPKNCTHGEREDGSGADTGSVDGDGGRQGAAAPADPNPEPGPPDAPAHAATSPNPATASSEQVEGAGGGADLIEIPSPSAARTPSPLPEGTVGSAVLISPGAESLPPTPAVSESGSPQKVGLVATEPKTVTIQRNASGWIGIVLGSPEALGAVKHYVAEVADDSLAKGKLQEGDLVVAVNGVLVDGKAHEEATSILKAAVGVDGHLRLMIIAAGEDGTVVYDPVTVRDQLDRMRAEAEDEASSLGSFAPAFSDFEFGQDTIESGLWWEDIEETNMAGKAAEARRGSSEGDRGGDRRASGEGVPALGPIAQAMGDFSPTKPSQLGIGKGEVVHVENDSKKWWLVRKADGTRGYVPSNFMRRVDQPTIEKARGRKAKKKKKGANLRAQDAAAATPLRIVF